MAASISAAPLQRSPRQRGGATGSRPQLRVVAAPRHARRYTVLLVLVALLGVFGILSLNAKAAESAFAARALEADVYELTVRYEELTAQVAALQAPARVEAVAADELGMVRAREPLFLLAEAETSSGDTERVSDPLKPVLGASR